MGILEIFITTCIPLISLWLVWSGWNAIKQQSDPAGAQLSSQGADGQSSPGAQPGRENDGARLPPILHVVYSFIAKVGRAAIQEGNDGEARGPWPLFVAVMMMALGMFGLLFTFFLVFGR